MIKGSRFDLPNNSVIELNKEITIPFVYFNPNNDNYEVEFEAREELFDNNANNIVIRRETKSRIAVTLKDYGCYYITAKVYNSSGTLVDRKYANITCLHRVDPQFVLYESTLISPDGYYGTWGLKYDVKFGEATTMAARFSCYVEQETERRRGYPIIGRRMDRQWRQRMIPIKLNRGRSSIYSLPHGSMVYEDNFTTAVCTYYTGSIFYIKNGLRNVESTNIEDLPLVEIETEVNNITGIPSEF